MPRLSIPLLSLLLILGGCASQAPISQHTWHQVDQAILLSSRAAATQAREQALGDMQRWLKLLQDKAERDYIPWYSAYWTQHWLGYRVAWYRLGSDADSQVAQRLARHLQDEYRQQVLQPVALKLAPPQILDNATRAYVRHLNRELPTIRDRHGIGAKPFNQHLQQIPAITHAPGASLYQVLQAGALDRLPAYRGLLKGIRPAAQDWAMQPAMLDLARHSSQQLSGELAGSGGASLVGMAAGPAVGVPLSLGVAIFQANTRAKRRPATEARLRQALQQSLTAHWQWLLDDREHGVLAGVYHLSGQIEGGLRGQAYGHAPAQTRQPPSTAGRP